MPHLTTEVVPLYVALRDADSVKGAFCALTLLRLYSDGVVVGQPPTFWKMAVSCPKLA